MNIENNIHNHYQQHWFSAGLEKFKLEDRSREEKIEITRHEFRRYIQQLTRSDVGKPNLPLNLPEKLINDVNPILRNGYRTGCSRLVAPRMCEIDKCWKPALPCARHCILHIMLNPEQSLFEHCTAKFSDNRQCSTPVLDILHELPLCTEHARKRDNYKLFQEGKPKKLKRKVKLSAMIRPQKRNKKRKRSSAKSEDLNISSNTLIETSAKTSNSDPDDLTEADSSTLEVEDIQMIDQVLGLNGGNLQTQPHLLEENDINNVLNTIQVDEFNDFFTVNRNGEYEPTREETEELEKALAAVDNDVKSLEKLSQSQGLLDSLLDENALNETLVQIPEMFHNGYASCGGNAVAQTASFLLPVVDNQSHS
ncbi:INO80 complex subunit D [Diorhabda sublineata]|uniref:INO80 complex subunit D n=1 Tax=Diorhabda sublineata TaxID=1163346 RepID=UPI0024E075E5|nr:INO80 complex subunit D [Diorhabda sublineata]